MNTILYIRFAFAVVLILSGITGIAISQTQPYNNSDANVTHDEWTDGHEDVTIQNVSHYFSRIGTFIIGDDPNDPGAGPLFTGLLVAGFGILVMGTSQAGLVASGTMAVIVVAALSAPAGTGFLPPWLYGVIVLVIAFVAGVIYVRMVR
ncbi:MAG: hypothetical protein RI531_04620 [Haloferacaceae archaeon]|nr:hypothetical protein [Haloferacaceae archaeon]